MSSEHENGNVTGSAAQVEQALCTSELNYRRLFETAQDGILILDAQTGRVNDVNPFLIKLLGFSRGEMVGKTVGELSPFKDIVSNQAMLARLQKDGYIRYHDLPLETKAGRKVNVEFVSNVYSVGDAQVIQCNIREITDRKRAEEALRTSRLMLDEIINGLPASVYWKDRNHIFLGCNTAFARDAGFAGPKDIIGKDDFQMGWCNQAEKYRGDDRQIMASGHAKLLYEDPQTTPGGKIITVLASKIPLRNSKGEIIGVLGTYMDITARKHAEEELCLFRALIDHSSDGVEVVDPETGRLLDVNETSCQRLGYTREELLSMRVADLGNVGVDFSNWGKHVEKVRQAGFINLEGQQKRKDGSTFPIEASIRYVKLERDYLLASVRDITERKRLEARFRRLVDSNAQGVAFWNTKGQITQANDAFLKLVGYTRANLAAGPIDWSAMTPPEYAGPDQRAMKELADTCVCKPFEKEYIRKDGKRVSVLIGAAAFEDDPREGVCFVLDLTERKKLEAQFRQSQKMDAIGKLAGGVAHDFNNILAVIQMQADLLKTEAGITPAQLVTAVEIGRAVQRASVLTRQLLLFSRKQMLQLRDLDLNESINEMTKMLRRTLRDDIKLQFKFAMQDIFVHADAGMMDQVLMNLAVNARDAMPKGGQLIIETSAVELDKAAAAKIPHARPGSFVRLSVSDTGCGIPPENFHRIFEPFFTTKDADKGTGLGLATVFGIVQLHQGWIDFQSQVGRGTTFRIYLPQLAGMPKQKPEPHAPAAVRGGDETILLVEDDAALCASVRKILSQLGYCVLDAVNGAEALKIWTQYGKDIHLLLTDLVMPGGMSGMDLGERLLKENPKLKVIYNSGYSAEVAGKDFALEEGVNFLTKPFEAQKLAQTVRQSLDTKIVV